MTEKYSMQFSDSLWFTIWLAESVRKGIIVKQWLTWNFTGEDTVTSATSQPVEGAPDRCQSASPCSPLHSTCTARMLEDPAGNQYLTKCSRYILKSLSDNSVYMCVMTALNSPEANTFLCSWGQLGCEQLSYFSLCRVWYHHSHEETYNKENWKSVVFFSVTAWLMFLLILLTVDTALIMIFAFCYLNSLPKATVHVVWI